MLALIALGVVFTLNMLSVKMFGEAEFWFAAIKVAAIILFMIAAIWAIVTVCGLATTPQAFTTSPSMVDSSPLG